MGEPLLRLSDMVTPETRIPLTQQMRDDLIEAMARDDAPTGAQIAEITGGRVSRSTVSKVKRNLDKREIEWEQWSLIARAVGLVAEDYLPPSITHADEPPPEWVLSEVLRRALPSARDRRLVERALEVLVQAGCLCDNGDDEDVSRRDARNRAVHLPGPRERGIK